MSAPTLEEMCAAVDEHLPGRVWEEEWWDGAGLAKAALWDTADLRPSEQGIVDAIMEAEAAILNRRIGDLAIEASLNALRRIADALPDLPRAAPPAA